MNDPSPATNPRDLAVARLHAKRAIPRTAGTFVVVAIVLTIIWALSGASDYWPVWPIGGMLIALAFQTWSAYRPAERSITDADIDQEMKRG